MINIIDFDHGCGGLTAGMERYGEFLVIDNVYLNKQNELCYNNTHINPFWTEAHVSEEDYDDLNIKVACFSPNTGTNSKKGIDLSELKTQMRWINTFHPEIVIFSIQPKVIPYLHSTEKKDLEPYTADGWPFFDKLLEFFHGNGYSSVQQFTINYLDYNIPINKKKSFYIAWNNNQPFQLNYPKFETRKKVMDVLSKLDINDSWHSPTYKYSINCSKIRPGSRASSVRNVNITSGYIRLVADRVAPNLYETFYLPSSKGPSIHPIEDRPLTIREGALINGLDIPFTWDNNLSNRIVAKMIVDSVSPVIGWYLGKSIFNLLT